MFTARLCLAFLLSLACADAARAHFLFIRLRPPAEAGRYAEVYFSDQADAGDPRFIDKIAHTKLWLQTKPGAFEPLAVHKTPDRLRAFVPSSGALSVIGECTYGVLGGPKGTPFLLRHYPKAVAGPANEIRALQPKAEIPFEISVRANGEGLEFIALRNGKPIPNAAFISVAADLKNDKFIANADGIASWKPPAAGLYAVYTSQTLKEAGTYQNEKYEEIREFTTLAFAWPLQTKAARAGSVSDGADPKAVQLFQEAIAARASWRDFPGFSAEVKALVDGRAWKGAATISAKGDVDLDKEDDVAAPWVKDQLESLVMHRLARTQEKSPILRFADDDLDHPLGRLLTFEGGKFASSYRVKHRQIMVVNRSLGKLNMTITILENELNAEKMFLPRSYSVHYWDSQKGNLQRSEMIQNRWTRLASWDLPTQLTVITSSAAGVSVKTMKLSQHRLLNADKKRPTGNLLEKR
jgi:hypothetical protein